ncbi:MAG: hypothetical protein CSA66_01285 [Proteobacteria bacterium]|nr:MAG: hypothetical protein CSA66_01285 [Pseudomonadota bacterium]
MFVGANVPLYYSALQMRSRDFRVPDLLVVLEAEPKQERPFWVVWEEGGQRPNLVVEVVSPSTEDQDRGAKMRIYSKVLAVPEYYIHDLQAGRLDGYTLDAKQAYVPIAADDRGRLPSAQLGGAFGVVRERYDGHDAFWLRLFEADGRRSPTAAEFERERAELERERAEALAARLAEYERRFGVLDGQGCSK